VPTPTKWAFNLDYDAIGNELAKAD